MLAYFSLSVWKELLYKFCVICEMKPQLNVVNQSNLIQDSRTVEDWKWTRSISRPRMSNHFVITDILPRDTRRCNYLSLHFHYFGIFNTLEQMKNKHVYKCRTFTQDHSSLFRGCQMSGPDLGRLIRNKVYLGVWKQITFIIKWLIYSFVVTVARAGQWAPDSFELRPMRF